MKKTYAKPELYFESFQMSANIASCGQFDFGKANSADKNTCGFDFYDVGEVFLDPAICDFQTQDGTGEMFCYHTASTANLFNS